MSNFRSGSDRDDLGFRIHGTPVEVVLFAVVLVLIGVMVAHGLGVG